MSGLRYVPDVVTLQLDEDKCSGCGGCIDVCPRAVFEMNSKKVHVTNRDACLECGACALNCPSGAITVNAGVGCATAVIMGWLRGTEPDCDCSGCCD